jgi:hypothetical protein
VRSSTRLVLLQCILAYGMTIGEVLRRRVLAQISEGAAAWLDEAILAARGPEPGLLRAYTEASRRLGEAPLTAQPGADGALPEALASFPLAHWTVEDAGRLLLLLERAGTEPHRYAAAAAACYEQGDMREQRSWLRGVGLLPDNQQFLPLAIDACRTSVVTLFEAIACENPYPAARFPDRNFNQVVLKAFFNGIAVERIVGLKSRLNPELARMASDYADERRAAGRTVPPDIGLVT